MAEKVALAVLDSSNTSLTIYDVDSELDSEGIEEFISENWHHLSNCSWAIFDGLIDDKRF